MLADEDILSARYGPENEAKQILVVTFPRVEGQSSMNMIMAFVDSVDKIFTAYFAAVCDESFEYKSHTYEPRLLRVSPGLFQGFTCPAGCGGCCPRFSLDYLPSETRPETPFMKPREIHVNNKSFTIWSDVQTEHKNVKCRNLNMENGRCGIHGMQPFSCDFELIRFMHPATDVPAQMTTRLFSRGWNMGRVDGKRGALCTITPITEDSKKDVIRKLNRLKGWIEYFEIKHKVDKIITWADSAYCHKPLFV